MKRKKADVYNELVWTVFVNYHWLSQKHVVILLVGRKTGVC